MFTLIITEKGGSQRRMEFDKPEVTIGRVQGNDIILPKGNVSKRHSRIVLKDSRFIVVDLKSTNGTYVNGRKITSPLVVKAGDKIYIGDFIITLDEAAGAEAGQAEHAPPPQPVAPPPMTGPSPEARRPPPLRPPGAPERGSVPPPPPVSGPPPLRRPSSAGFDAAPPPYSPPAAAPPPAYGAPPAPAFAPPPPAYSPPPAYAAPAPPAPAPQPYAAPPPAYAAPAPAPAPPPLRAPTLGYDAPPPIASRAPAPAPEPSRRPITEPPPAAERFKIDEDPSDESIPPSPRISPPAAVHIAPARVPDVSDDLPTPAPAPAPQPAPAPSLGATVALGSTGPVPAPTPAPQPAPEPAAPVTAAAPSALRATAASRPRVAAAPRASGAGLRGLVARLAETFDVHLEDPHAAAAESRWQAAREGIDAALAQMAQDGSLDAGADREGLATAALHEAVGLGALEPYLGDAQIRELVVESAERIVLDRGKGFEAAAGSFSSPAALSTIARRLLARGGHTAEGPLADVRLDNGWSASVIDRPVAPSGPIVVLRRAATGARTLDDLVLRGVFDAELARVLRSAVSARRTVLVVGAPGAGITTLLSALAHATESSERLAIIERTPGIHLERSGSVSLRAGHVALGRVLDQAQLLRAARVVVDDLRGADAYDLLAARPGGALVGLHAADPDEALRQLEVLASLDGRAQAPSVRALLGDVVQLIVHVARVAGGAHRVVGMTEVRTESGAPVLASLFAQRSDGSVAAVGAPSF